MAPQNLPKHFDLLAAPKAYAEGKDITDRLLTQHQVSHNTTDIIETAYDLQAGTYFNSVQNNYVRTRADKGELALVLDRCIGDQNSCSMYGPAK